MKTTILLYGRTGSGKTAQVGVLAEHVKKTTGLDTRLYTGDRGGLDTIRPHTELGIIHPIQLGDSDPWVFLNKAVRGYIRDQNGKWILDKEANKKIGLYAFESIRAFAESLMAWMAEKAGGGLNIGGSANVGFSVQGDGETLKVSGSNMAHFGISQSRMTSEIWESQKLDAPYILWTSSVSKDEDTTSSGKVLGPDAIGKALTPELPRWFNRTYRIDVIPQPGGKPEKHVLYLGSSIDSNAGNVAALGNLRMPLDAPQLQSLVIDPADIVKALAASDGSVDAAKSALKKRLGL